MSSRRDLETPGHSASPCDTCRHPGRCCVGFAITAVPRGLTGLEAMAWIEEHTNQPLTYMPLFRDRGGVWRWWCPLLDVKTGRCGDYEHRPSMCRSFEPRQDALCAEFCVQPSQDEWRRRS